VNQDFKTWYEQWFGVVYPGQPGEPTHVVLHRMAQGLAEWADMIAKEARR